MLDNNGNRNCCPAIVWRAVSVIGVAALAAGAATARDPLLAIHPMALGSQVSQVAQKMGSSVAKLMNVSSTSESLEMAAARERRS